MKWRAFSGARIPLAAHPFEDQRIEFGGPIFFYCISSTIGVHRRGNYSRDSKQCRIRSGTRVGLNASRLENIWRVSPVGQLAACTGHFVLNVTSPDSGSGTASKEKDAGNSNQTETVQLKGSLTIVESFPFNGLVITITHKYGVHLRRACFAGKTGWRSRRLMRRWRRRRDTIGRHSRT